MFNKGVDKKTLILENAHILIFLSSSPYPLENQYVPSSFGGY